MYFVIQILIKIDNILYFKYLNDILPSSARIFIFFLHFCNVANESKEDIAPTIEKFYKRFHNISKTFLADKTDILMMPQSK